ncbi:transcriptional regulator, BadM/Rrf2 family [Roseovarius azorensis]|uniref:Transcriptional regulator, BadM/Rrf2 family n=1 Tax=Roseovarius azorensis TaxID=1287727 RepID=A0A1H7T187_9RHOB|nr:Rrf2 family transcriptional regulator [Roseovarius azorensis]SEL78680.1 transcriptional regulator, BadM/Rrf2 family [Roseovarius azorensis]
MRITKRTNIAIRLLMFCASSPDRLVTKAEIARRCNTSESHLAQIINRLARLGYLNTQRGRTGGVMLGQPADQITVGAVFRALEENTPVAECFADVDNTCPLVDACRLRLALADALEAFYVHLDEVTLDALVCNNDALFTIFSSTPCMKRA